jgi:hypothetical protein
MQRNIEKIRNAKLLVIYPYQDEHDRLLRKQKQSLPTIADDEVDEWNYDYAELEEEDDEEG